MDQADETAILSQGEQGLLDEVFPELVCREEVCLQCLSHHQLGRFVLELDQYIEVGKNSHPR